MINVVTLAKTVFNKSIENIEDLEALEAAVETWIEAVLNPREGKVVKCFYGIGTLRKNAKEIGSDFDVVARRIIQIKAKALNKMRTSLRQGDLLALAVKDIFCKKNAEDIYGEILHLRQRNAFLEEKVSLLIDAIASLNDAAQGFVHTRSDDTAEMRIGALSSLEMRTINTLKACNINFVNELLLLTEDEVLRLPNCGPKMLKNVKNALQSIGYKLKQ